MATPVRDQIVSALQTKLLEITTGAGYEQTIDAVFIDGQATINLDEKFGVVVQDLGDDPVNLHLSLVYEGTAQFDVKPAFHDGDAASRRARLAKLHADCVKKLLADETLGGLAKKMYVRSIRPALSEAADVGQGSVLVEVLYRVKRYDPYTVTDI